MQEPPLEQLGKQIAVLRKRKKWSQDRFSEESGLARSYVAEVELGRINISFRNLHRIAVALDVSLPELLSFDVKPANQSKFDE